MFANTQKKTITIQDIYPDFTPQEQAEAEYNFREYALLVWRIYERVKRENPEILTKLLKKDRV
jgi:hypothetical protein